MQAGLMKTVGTIKGNELIIESDDFINRPEVFKKKI
jgi:hypothetical protein